ncbi:ATP-binding protein [Roseinatronobacter alkalisoli]|uniref:histidine kinase n=1 Tax=Roseinatronobacter alkalisoli TaxID=3028235 RepID=A0ABT5T3Q1_9RHOB|nr:ATP-binding protein [Roseinatronobacter sp. HJB301]MDD7969634.1 ATP-binding protein [Roseinatronobacter sp. HJB301]
MHSAAISRLIAALPQPVLLIDMAGFVQRANPPALELFGAHIVDAQIRAHLRQPDVTAMLERVLAGAADGNATFNASAGSRETVWRVMARHADAQTIVLSLGDISDIEAAEAQRRDFVANVSHELRSPLTVLSGFIETLQGPAGDDPVARSEFLGIMAEQSARMTGLVADLLSLSRVEAAEKIRPRTPVSIDMVLKATLAALRPQTDAAQVQITYAVAADLPDIPGDYDQLVQVFHNLIENGLKYGSGGGRLDISAQQLAAMPGFDGPVLRVSIRDFGEGIDPVHIPRLTERFYRVDKARSRDSGGTGLGLAIVKHILSRHRGRLSIRSTQGEGAAFDALLPCN